MQPCAPPPHPAPRAAACTYQLPRVYATDTYIRAHTWDDFYVWCTLRERCHRVPTGSSNYRSLSTSTFLADWFEEKCRANFGVTFSALANEARPSAGCRAFECHKETYNVAASCVFQQILSDAKDDALRDPNVCHVALSEFRPNRLLVHDDSQTINLRS